MKSIILRTLFAFLVATLIQTETGNAQQFYPRPNLLAISRAGGQAGTSVEVKITEHFELNYATGLVFSHPGITAEPKMSDPDQFFDKPRPVSNTFLVNIQANTPPGIYEVRAVSRYGLTNPRRFVVGTEVETLEKEKNDSIADANSLDAGTTVNGTFASDYDFFRFPAKRGQRLLLNCLAERIDSRGDPVLTIFDANGKVLQRTHDTTGRDPVADFSPPADGDYFVRVNDLIYMSSGGSGTAPYRLSIVEGPWIDFIEPSIAQRGTTQSFTLYGRNLGGTKSDVFLNGQTLEAIRIDLAIPKQPRTGSGLTDTVVAPFAAAVDSLTYRHKVNGRFSNPIRIATTNQPTQFESEPNNSLANASSLTGPTSIYGHFDQPGDVDSFTFQAAQGETKCLEILSQQLGFPTDVALVIQQVIQQKDGTQTTRDLKTYDDPPKPRSAFRFDYITSDPAAIFTAPTDGLYRVIVRDQFGGATRSIPHAYCLSIREPEPDFHLFAAAGIESGPNGNNNQNLMPKSCVVRRNSASEIIVNAFRHDGYDGPIELQIEGLPAGLSAEPAIIGAKLETAALLIHAGEQAAAWHGLVKVTGTATIGDRKITRFAQPLHVVWANRGNTFAPTRLATAMHVCVDDKTQFPGRLEIIGDQKTLRMSRGGKIELSAKFINQNKVSGNINCQAYGLPQQISRRPLSLNSNGTAGKLTFDIRHDCPPGRYSFFLRGDVNQNIRLYPEEADAAKADQQRIAKLSKELDQAYGKAEQNKRNVDRQYQQAVQAKTSAASKVSTAQRNAQQREREFKAAETQLAAATKTLTAAMDAVVSAQKELDAATEETKKPIQTAFDSATQTLSKAKSAHKTAQQNFDKAKAAHTKAKDELTTQQKAEEAAETKRKQLDESRQKANDTREQTQKDRDLARNKKREIDQLAQRAGQISQSRQKRFYAYSRQIILDIAATPAPVALSRSKIEITAGQQFKFKATTSKEFGFDDIITLTLQPPRGVTGITFPTAKIEKGKTETALDIKTTDKTQPGTYPAEILARLRFNNRALEQRLPVEITIKPPG